MPPAPLLLATLVRGRYESRNELTDQSETLIYARSGAREVATRMYDVRAEDAKLPASAVWPVPKALHELHRLLATVSHVGSTKWQPRYIEVMLSPYPHQKVSVSAHWPAGWPGIKSDRAFARGGGQYSIYLESRLQPQLYALMDQQKDHGGIELGGSVWVMSSRIAFPGEPVWTKAFLDADTRGSRP